MTDIVDSATRSRIMRAVRSRDTAPEMAVRRRLHRRGFRFRTSDPRLPGRPDLSLPRHRAAVFVHGCFWHRHPGCKYATTPASNREMWTVKFARNRQRDARNQRDLRNGGWRVMVVWECSLKGKGAAERATKRLERWIRGDDPTGTIPDSEVA